MLQIKQIQLIQFRNYQAASFQFTERIVGICGANGSGKSNLLDAIYYLSFTKSYLSKPDSQNVKHGYQGLKIEGALTLNQQPIHLVGILRENNKKEFIINQEPYKKFSEHIGKFPSVMIAPDDGILITGSSEHRRNFIDTLLCQISGDYLSHLIHYNKVLQQRNAYLKQQAFQKLPIEEALLSIFDQQLCQSGNEIFKTRTHFLKQFLPLVASIYTNIAGQSDHLHLTYHSQLTHTSFSQLLKDNQSKDALLQRTSAGIHRDELILQMKDLPFKSEASQGQRKSLLFALKLAEWQSIKETKGFSPILLLDDVFEKLDQDRMQQLLNWVCHEGNGQVFITDTHADRVNDHLSKIGFPYQLITL